MKAISIITRYFRKGYCTDYIHFAIKIDHEMFYVIWLQDNCFRYCSWRKHMSSKCYIINSHMVLFSIVFEIFIDIFQKNSIVDSNWRTSQTTAYTRIENKFFFFVENFMSCRYENHCFSLKVQYVFYTNNICILYIFFYHLFCKTLVDVVFLTLLSQNMYFRTLSTTS